MTDMRLIGGPNSPFVRKVLIALMAKDLLDRVELVRIVPAAAMTVINPELMAKNPIGKIPILEVSPELRLFESDLICEYLDTSFGPPTLIPPAGAARWQTLQWNALGTGAMEMLIVWRLERLRPPELQDRNIIASCTAKTRAVLAEMDRELPALAAAPFGLGHIAWGCFLGYLDFRFDEIDWRSIWPAGVPWFEEFMAGPGGITRPVPDVDSRTYPNEESAPRLVWG